MKQLLLILLCLPFIQSGQAQNEIRWSKDVRLQWTDFKGEPDGNNPFAALTRSGFRYKYKYDNDSLTVESSANFRPESSWVKKQSDNLLAHEQLHFDITEYYRRVFLQRLSTASITQSNAKQLIADIQQQTIKDMQKEQMLYDEETNHSINKDAQEKWRLKYLQRLNESFATIVLNVKFTK